MIDESYPEIDGFSLSKGGPIYRAMLRVRLAGPDSAHVLRRATFLALFTWLPLLILSVLQGVALGDFLRVPFLFDFSVAIRFLIAVPLLIIAEIPIDRRLAEAVAQFIRSRLLRTRDMPAFESAVRQAIGLGNSNVAEAVILVIILVQYFAGIRVELPHSISTWLTLASDFGARRTLAGWWYAAVSIPIYQFLLYRWLWRFIIWSKLLWRISRLNLELIPTHPDFAAGLGFIGESQAWFGMVIFAVSAVMSSAVAQRILLAGATLSEFKSSIVGFVVLMLVIFLGPLFVFNSKLYIVRRKGLLEYGALASEYVRSFDRKWLRGKAPEGEHLIGSPDLQSLADLGGSLEIVRKMRPVVFDISAIAALAGVAAGPFAPLLLTEIPLDEIIMKILGLLL